MIHEVIYQLYPAAVSIVDDIPYDIEGNTITVDMDDYNAIASDIIAELDLKQLRAKRDILLAETDWWMMPDRTATDEQIAYRQALRDITDTYTSLEDVVWPTKPD
jgi:hypothetical protein